MSCVCACTCTCTCIHKNANTCMPHTPSHITHLPIHPHTNTHIYTHTHNTRTNSSLCVHLLLHHSRHPPGLHRSDQNKAIQQNGNSSKSPAHTITCTTGTVLRDLLPDITCTRQLCVVIAPCSLVPRLYSLFPPHVVNKARFFYNMQKKLGVETGNEAKPHAQATCLGHMPRPHAQATCLGHMPRPHA